VVGALEARRRALESGDRKALEALRAPEAEGGGGQAAELEKVLELQRRHYRAAAWYLRLERDGAVVSEEWRLEGQLPSRPVDERGLRQLSLVRSGEEFLFSPGLM
jgi:hypothetical protein